MKIPRGPAAVNKRFHCFYMSLEQFGKTKAVSFKPEDLPVPCPPLRKIEPAFWTNTSFWCYCAACSLAGSFSFRLGMEIENLGKNSPSKGIGKMKGFKIRHKTSLLCALLLAAIMIAGCNSAPQSKSEPSGISSGVTVDNANNEQVTIESEPQRIVVLPIWEAEMVIDLIGTDRIVGLSPFIDSSANSACADKAANVKERVSSNQAEKILALQPDLVLLDTFNDFDGSLTATLKEAGVTVLTLESPMSFEQISDRIDVISKAVFAPEKGQQLIEEMQQRLDSVKQRVKNVEQRIKVMYYEDYYSEDGTSDGMLCAYGPGSTFDEIASAAGAINVCAAQNYSAVNKETVLNEWKPELLIVPSIKYDENFNAVDDQGKTIISAIKNDKILSSLPAVKNDRLYALPDKYRSSTSHYMAYAVEELAKVCYPDLFE